MDDPKKEISRWRDRINKTDLKIVKLLNERTKCAEEIGKIKLLHGMEIYSPKREEEVKRNVSTANRGPLSTKAIQRIFECIIDESRSAERITVDKKKRRNK